MTFTEYQKLVDLHDFSYNYSDDNRVYSYYSSLHTKIMNFINTTDNKKSAIDYYNSVVEKKINKDFHKEFKMTY
jgi:hypothetical protein